MSIEDLELLTIEIALEVVAQNNKKLSEKFETRQKFVNATMKSLGKVAGEGLKEFAKTSTHAEVLIPLSWVSDVAVEELGKAFAESMLTLSDSKDSKLSELLDQSVNSGFELRASS